MPRAAKKAPGVQEVIVPEMDIQTITFGIEGNAPLVSHAWSHKAIQMIKDKQSGKPAASKKNREARDPEEDYRQSMYYTPEGRPGLPARLLKSCAVEVANDVGMFKTDAKRAFFVVGDILPIENAVPRLREDMVRLESGVADIRYRAEFPTGWRVQVTVRYNNGVITAAHLINLFRHAGFGCGLMEGRPNSPKSCGMGWGTFDVMTEGLPSQATEAEEVSKAQFAAGMAAAASNATKNKAPAGAADRARRAPAQASPATA